MSYLKSLSRRDLLKTGVAAGSLQLLVEASLLVQMLRALEVTTLSLDNGNPHPNGSTYILTTNVDESAQQQLRDMTQRMPKLILKMESLP